MTIQRDELSFRVSSGLKNIIGKDLISDKFIAIFELVKNSYDAGAHQVIITFQDLESENAQIIISDDGSGMNYDDIVGKWLFVAYSDKRKKSEEGYRGSIKRNLAGAKGVGRFSCDRLGERLTLVTKVKQDSIANAIDIDWNRFEADDSEDFISIPIQHYTMDVLPNMKENGTTLIISGLRETWDRNAILKLKRSLMKLIDPDTDNKEDPFSIIFNVPEMIADDEKIRNAGEKKEGWERDVVNGVVANDVFEAMNIKTTNIKVVISEDGKSITTKLLDRGEFIFSFSEKNSQYPLLFNISISLFYLNRSAKTIFTRRMGGVQPGNYGSVFIYKNGFRINPYGDPGEDFFNIDKRKAQGYKRRLGTREIMGRISIQGGNDQFVETTSRAHGFINTPAVESLATFFSQKVLRVLERYVVNIISWGEPIKSDPEHKTIMPLDAAESIISEFADLSRQSDIIDVEYNPMLLDAPTEAQGSSLSQSIDKLEKVATKSQNATLTELAQTVRDKTKKMMEYNISLEKENAKQEKALQQERVNREAREKQVFFLQGLTDTSTKNLINGMHLIYTSTEVVRGGLQEIRKMLEEVEFAKRDDILASLAEVMKANSKANKTAELAIKGEQQLKQVEPRSISGFIRQYIDAGMALKGIRYNIHADNSDFVCRFDPASIGVILDNIASNSMKAKADKLEILFYENEKYVMIDFCDNGVGLAVSENIESIFEFGWSANAIRRGFGIGLSEIKELAEDMGGTVKVLTGYTEGFGLEVSIAK